VDLFSIFSEPILIDLHFNLAARTNAVTYYKSSQRIQAEATQIKTTPGTLSNHPTLTFNHLIISFIKTNIFVFSSFTDNREEKTFRITPYGKTLKTKGMTIDLLA
jgi:hypothetical protein